MRTGTPTKVAASPVVSASSAPTSRPVSCSSSPYASMVSCAIRASRSPTSRARFTAPSAGQVGNQPARAGLGLKIARQPARIDDDAVHLDKPGKRMLLEQAASRQLWVEPPQVE